MAREEAYLTGGGSAPDIEILAATGFDNLLAIKENVRSFFQCIGDCTALLGGTVEGNTGG